MSLTIFVVVAGCPIFEQLIVTGMFIGAAKSKSTFLPGGHISDTSKKKAWRLTFASRHEVLVVGFVQRIRSDHGK